MSDAMFVEEQKGQPQEDHDMTDDPVPELPQSIQHNQRTIHAFFGGPTTSQVNLPEGQVLANNMGSPFSPNPQDQNQ